MTFWGRKLPKIAEKRQKGPFVTFWNQKSPKLPKNGKNETPKNRGKLCPIDFLLLLGVTQNLGSKNSNETQIGSKIEGKQQILKW